MLHKQKFAIQGSKLNNTSYIQILYFKYDGKNATTGKHKTNYNIIHY